MTRVIQMEEYERPIPELATLEMVDVYVHAYELNLQVPKQVIDELAIGKSILGVGFEIDDDLQHALCKAAGIPRLARLFDGYYETLSPDKIQEIRKAHKGMAAAYQMHRALVQQAELEHENTIVLYWGMGLGSVVDNTPNFNFLNDHRNMNSWFYWYCKNMVAYEQSEDMQAKRVSYELIGKRTFVDTDKEGNKTIRESFKRDIVHASYNRKGELSSLVLLEAVSLVDSDNNVNVLNKLVHQTYVNGVLYTKEMLARLIVLSLVWNVNHKTGSPAGQIRKALRGAVERPIREDMDTQEVVEGEVETTTKWWTPDGYYQRSPLGMQAQAYRITCQVMKFVGAKIVFQADGQGSVFLNTHLPGNTTVLSIPAAGSKAEKWAGRTKLYLASCVEVVYKHNGQLAEVESAIFFAPQENGLVFTHDQHKYHIGNSFLGVFAYTPIPTELIMDFGEASAQEIVDKGQFEVLSGSVIPTQAGLINELAKEMGLDISDDDDFDDSEYQEYLEGDDDIAFV